MQKRSFLNKTSNRIERVQVLIKESLAEIFTKEDLLDNKNERISVIITDVVVSPDIKLAKVFIRPFNRDNIDREEFVNLLSGYSPVLFKSLSRILQLKYTPKLVFKYDDSLENYNRINSLFNEDVNKKVDELLDSN